MNAIDHALFEILRETLSEIYETVVVPVDPDSPLTFSHLSEIVRKEHTELVQLRTEVARLRAECEAAENLIHYCDIPSYASPEHEVYRQVRAAHPQEQS